jgi:hypothetical protein
MLNNLKQLFTNTLESFSDTPENFQRVQLMLSIENNYDNLSNNRFANSNDYQRKQKALLTSISGMSKIVNLTNKFKP